MNKTGQESRQIKCKNCNGVMDLDFDKGIAICPYCGSTETIGESDTIKIERMRQKAEADKRNHEQKEAERQASEDAIKEFKRRPLSKVILAVACLALLLTVSNFRYRPFASIMMAIAGAVLAFSWVIGAGLAKNVKQRSYIIVTIVGFALLIFAFSLG